MSSRLRSSLPPLVALLLVVPLLVASLSARTVAAAGSSLQVSPSNYVGGQRLVFDGQLGATGRRKVHLELNLSRPGDEWKVVDDFTPVWTDDDGSFRFGYIAPAMFGIQMRVASGKLATPGWTFDAKSQDLVMHAEGAGLPDNRMVAGVPFTVEVDTTADLVRRPDSPSPVFPGRAVTLQRRTADGLWQDVSTSVTDSHGIGAFPMITMADPGETVFRVRQENWSEGGDQVGWYPSFPTFVNVYASAGAAQQAAASEPAPVEAAPARTVVRTPVLSRDTASTTASQSYRWTPSLWDFGWTYGESLTSPPSRGTEDDHGWWLDSSTGTGRAAKHNGGLMLDSQRDNKDGVGRSDGTTRATLQDQPMKYGRWEVRLRVKSTDTRREDFRTVIELVPADPDADGCTDPVVTIADVEAHDSGLGIGVRNGGSTWSRTESGVRVNGVSHAVAVEVTPRHITWFVEGRPVGTVRKAAAIPDVPMNLRVSLVGDGQQAMNRTQSIFDWMRGFSLASGEKVSTGPKLMRRDASC